jgi:hypothetical protein
MTRKSVERFSEKIVLKRQIAAAVSAAAAFSGQVS